MSLGRALSALALAALASLGLSVALSPAEEAPPADSPVHAIEWAFRPASLGSMEQESTAAVIAEVTEVRAGPDLVARAEGDPTSVIRIPTQRIELRAQRTLSGSAPESFTLFKQGSAEYYFEGDPFYRVGERYLLFIRKREASDGTYLPVAPDGRLLIEPDGELKAFVDGPGRDRLEGKTANDADQEIASVEG